MSDQKPPIKYSFKCGKCGSHRVDQTTFEAHITPAIRDQIAHEEGVTKARLVFNDDGCPVCLPQNVVHTRVADVEIAKGRALVAHINP